MSEIAQVPKEAIGVVLEDATAEDWYVGGTTVAELKRTGKSCAARTAVSKSTTRPFSPWSTRPSASSNCRHSMANLDRQQSVWSRWSANLREKAIGTDCKSVDNATVHETHT